MIIHPPQGINTKLNRQFTQIIAKLFKSQGYNIINIDGFEDNGGDLLLEKDSTKYAVQIKHYNPLSNTERIKPSDIQKFYATKKLTGVDRLIFLTTTYFYSHAIDKANDLGIELIDREQLFQLFANYHLNLLPRLLINFLYKISLNAHIVGTEEFKSSTKKLAITRATIITCAVIVMSLFIRAR
ncbi:restriction endonuclease [Listeria booriae]|uniref:Restriction endonuclease n=1 Tax=Listeria booriae TaxID=1552123 RepID=A0A7X0Z0G6_9LIST|nr:restriction endonuclease [Listeria booriae]MBC2166948.1 restriction endonuclease [Listeria booriae]